MFNPGELARLLDLERARVWAILSSPDTTPTALSDILDQVLQDAAGTPREEPPRSNTLRLSVDYPWETAVDLSPLLWLVEILVRLAPPANGELLLTLEDVTRWIDYAVNQEQHRLTRLQAAARSAEALGTRRSGDNYECRRELLDYILSLN